MNETPRHTIAGVTPTVCALLGITPPARSTADAFRPLIERIQAQCSLRKIDKCLIYAPDALGTLFIHKHQETFAPMIDLAPISIELRSMLPPKMPVCFASMFTGAEPAIHGIRMYEKPVLACDTLFDALIRAGKKPAIVAVRDSSIDLIFRGRDMAYFFEEYDPQVTARAIELLQADQHDLIVAYHQEYDDALHATTHESGRALAAAKNHARSFVTLCEEFHKQWRAHDRLMIFAPDHGAHVDPATGKGAHGDDIPEDMLVTHFFAARRGV